MIELYGRMVCQDLQEVVDPSHTAIIVVDMQNEMGGNTRTITGALKNLLDAGRKAGVRIVYIVYTNDPDHASSSTNWIYAKAVMGRERPGAAGVSALEICYEGTSGQEVLPEIAPEPGDITVRKYHRGAFAGTNLDMTLRGLGIQTVVVTGVGTSHCVLDTVVGAHGLNYYTVVAEDCVADGSPEMHERGLGIFRDRYDCPSSEDLITMWAMAPERVAA